MSRKELQRSLELLEAEVEKLDTDDGSTKKRIQDLVAGLERQLESSDAGAGQVALIDRLRYEIEQFEVEHPRITGVMNRIMVALSDMGI